ncbi:hypothetical protein N9913_00090 [Porticoccaceae bacterium]|nr:hypothetical protein [Porticoccaceae bacterium]MDB4308686.1 hypothetical protein [Porticoccaceae bacterium]MDB9953805.1 hypothetical protein [Porticoccaceae bacterium]MDB9999880.1 hypothetical protein [Porticoccaceae bacterium]
MNTVVAGAFFLVALLLPIKPLFSKCTAWLMSLQSWGRFAVVDFMIAVPLILWIVSTDSWYYYTVWIALFTLGLLLVCEAIYLLAVDIDLCKKHLQLVLKHYYAIALPLALLCLVLSLFILGRAYIGPVVAVSDCKSGAQLSIACGVTNPEDLAITPDGQFIIVSEFGSIAPIAEFGSGRLALLNAQTKRPVPLPIIYSENSWGDGSCEKTAESPFGPHGIDLVTREDGRYQLAVVNHMAHESVEMFELVALERELAEDTLPDEPSNQWGLVWRGCVVAPTENYLNDVSLLTDGSFFVSHMFGHDFSVNDFLTVTITKQNTGYVLHWDKTHRFSQVPNTDGAQPNGVAYDEQNGLLYVAFNLADRVAVIDLDLGVETGSFSINAPDNLILKAGSLWVTSLDHEILDVFSCEETGVCALPFTVTELDALSLDRRNSWSFKGEPFGLPTVALPLGDEVLIGSFRSERLAFFLLDDDNVVATNSDAINPEAANSKTVNPETANPKTTALETTSPEAINSDAINLDATSP